MENFAFLPVSMVAAAVEAICNYYGRDLDNIVILVTSLFNYINYFEFINVSVISFLKFLFI
jgi:hypothetical protein